MRRRYKSLYGATAYTKSVTNRTTSPQSYFHELESCRISVPRTYWHLCTHRLWSHEVILFHLHEWSFSAKPNKKTLHTKKYKKRLKRKPFHWTKQDRMQIFEGIIFFLQNYEQYKNRIQIQYKNRQTSTLPHARIQLAAAKWFVCFCIVRSFEKEDFLEKSHPVLFYLVKKRSF